MTCAGSESGRKCNWSNNSFGKCTGYRENSKNHQFWKSSAMLNNSDSWMPLSWDESQDLPSCIFPILQGIINAFQSRPQWFQVTIRSSWKSLKPLAVQFKPLQNIRKQDLYRCNAIKNWASQIRSACRSCDRLLQWAIAASSSSLLFSRISPTHCKPKTSCARLDCARNDMALFWLHKENPDPASIKVSWTER